MIWSAALSLSPTHFLYEHDATRRVGTIVLNRPERLNALTFESYKELGDAFRTLDKDPSVRSIVLTGTGRGFCSGGDVEDIIGQLFSRDQEGLLEFTRLTCSLIDAMRRCRKPIVAALNRTVSGAGAVMAASADIRMAAPEAKIAFLFTRVGLSGADMGIAWLLPRIIGFGRATELLMTGDFIGAEEAHRIGLYNHVVPAAELRNKAAAMAEKLAKGPAYGLEMTKELLNREAFMDLDTALRTEAEAQAACMMHPDFREAYESFREKRAPKFK